MPYSISHTHTHIHLTIRKGDFRHTVIILAPFSDPIPFTRGWCLFEIYCTIITESKLEIAMSETHTNEFFDLMRKDVHRNIKDMLSTIDAERSECFKVEDKERIFDVVRKEIGFNKINSMVFNQLRNWVIKVTKDR